ncbi:STAS domain-containing protein [Tolumonas osonensis]|uniref:Anti-sigma factor antagonist n=1 Tax=Tolumonas osonensis TaxID=675874 RepID=A0A841GMB6_9GAMM|nr:STAS domain-containing protein [Tolumonas osonensis]MBB6055910.1 anti-anti-sigma factor [Tolumonas osonensis]
MPVITYTMNHTLVLTIDGELDHATVEEIRRIFNSLIQKHSDVLVDLSSVSFIDSAGIGSLIYLYKQLQANGRRLRLICKPGQPRELLSILHIDRSITCYLSIRDFLADISDKQSKTCLSDSVSLVI